MLRSAKEQKLSYYGQVLEDGAFVFLADPTRINIRTMDELRARFAEVGAKCVFLKNTLARIFFEREKMSEICELLVGPTLMITGVGDVGSVARIIREVQRDSRDQLLKIKGIFFGGKLYPQEEFKFFSSLPSLHEARTRTLMLLKQPMRNLAFILSETRARLYRCLKARADSA